MAGTIDPDGLGFVFGDLARLFRSGFESEIGSAESSVTPAEARVLAHMSRQGAIRQNRLACLLGVTPMSLSAFLDRLEEAGLVARGTDPADRRAKIVTLTPAASPVLEHIAAAGRRTRDRALRNLSGEERHALTVLTLRVRENLSAARSERLAETGA